MADAAVIDWYDQKTEYLLEKYGPGPRVHYHTGLVPPHVAPAADLAGILRQLRDAQEEMLDRALREWHAELRGRLLDVGAGFGGSAIAFAQRFDVHVTALTPVSRHIPIIERFAREAGVEGFVAPLLGDAHDVDGRFDAAYCFGASTYFDRERWFRCLAGVLPAGGCVYLEDTFLGRADVAHHFDEYWLARIGSIEEYEKAAAAAGFELVRCADVSREAAGFWGLTLRYSQLRMQARLEARALAERAKSAAWYELFERCHLDGGFRELLVAFRKR